MIPHHSGAILMCEQAALTDPDIVALCRQIVRVAAGGDRHDGAVAGALTGAAVRTGMGRRWGG
jgi:hypothetical protein